jgi:hypothetical protein
MAKINRRILPLLVDVAIYSRVIALLVRMKTSYPKFVYSTLEWIDGTNIFQMDLDRGEIIGLTAIGRVTIEVLRMNEPSQILARLLWIQLRLFP